MNNNLTVANFTSKYHQAIQVCRDFKIPASYGMSRALLYSNMRNVLGYMWFWSDRFASIDGRWQLPEIDDILF